MQQIADWLEKLGLGQYVRHFAENGIDASVLGYLTDQDLEKIGVLLGHRRKMLAAIAELGSAAPASQQPVVTERAPQNSAERPPSNRDVLRLGRFNGSIGTHGPISAYQDCVAETVGRLGGFIAKFMGDGVLVYFGYPHAHEDDAERAVRAGLKLVAAVSDLKTHASLQTRVGIATGLVVVGDLIGSGASQEQAIVGETPNLAARLQGVAEPNSVVIAESTRRLVGNLFELTAALLERVAPEPHTRLRYFCSPQHTDSALYPIISQMERASGFTHNDTAQAKLDKLDALLAQNSTPPQGVALLADMLSLPNDGRYPTLQLDPHQRRQKTLEALTAQMEALSRTNPVLTIFEDVHWTDPTSHEVLGRTVERLRTLGVLLIVTYRRSSSRRGLDDLTSPHSASIGSVNAK